MPGPTSCCSPSRWSTTPSTRVTWLDATHFVYTDHDASGERLLQTDVATGRTAPLFDAQALAAALNTLLATGDKPIKAEKWDLNKIPSIAVRWH